MDATTDERLRSAVLYGAAVAVLAVGGWWWHSAAPSPVARPADPAAAPAVGPSAATPSRRVLPDGAEVTARVGADTGEVVRRPDAARMIIDTATGKITDIEGDPSWLFFQGELPPFRDTTWQERRPLVPGQRVVRQAAGGNARQLLQYRCTRPGTLSVTTSGAELAGPSEIDCDGMTTSAEVLSHGRPFRVSLSTVGVREIDVEAQLVTLPD
ncbi:hypothetical protein [Micromonospora chokoriensis]|uniref:hypothetical protein n=1 Tax=Micromonospora chokoriensis TaxID=356851 RepID=UPI0004C374C8|nr:hypothetical protein [Micromonospora chokoriensis]